MFKTLVNAEKNRAREFNGSFSSLHEIYGVLAEETQEFFDEVRKKPDDRDPNNLLSELVQIAAVAEMAAEDLELVDVEEKDESSSMYINLKNKVKELMDSRYYVNRSLQSRERPPITETSFNKDIIEELERMID
jgi:NTP pyrophosphatase (non-canonical NTP hydrolase)